MPHRLKLEKKRGNVRSAAGVRVNAVAIADTIVVAAATPILKTKPKCAARHGMLQPTSQPMLKTSSPMLQPMLPPMLQLMLHPMLQPMLQAVMAMTDRTDEPDRQHEHHEKAAQQRHARNQHDAAGRAEHDGCCRRDIMPITHLFPDYSKHMRARVTVHVCMHVRVRACVRACARASRYGCVWICAIVARAMADNASCFTCQNLPRTKRNDFQPKRKWQARPASSWKSNNSECRSTVSTY